MHEKKLLRADLVQVKAGALLSYALIILNSIYGLLVTPYIIRTLGEADYGVYVTVASLSASLAVLDFGLSGTVMRYVANYRSDDNDDAISDFAGLAAIECGIIVVFVSAVCLIIYRLIPVIYNTGLTVDQLWLAKKLFIFLTINIEISIIENILYGLIAGYNKFIIANGVKFIRVIFRIAFTYLFLGLLKTPITLVVIDLSLTLIVIICEVIYIKTEVKLKIKFKNLKETIGLFKESLQYTIIVFLTSIVAEVNGSLDNVVIGAQLGASFVTIYSMGLIIFVMFETISTSISGVMLPTVTKILKEDETGERIKTTIVKTGRIQFMLLGATVAGFAVLGKQFINLWLGKGFEEVYYIALLLMCPSLLELCVNVCLSVLRAKNKLKFRTIILCLSTLLNAFITVVGVKTYGYYAAAIGTGISFLVGSDIIMNVYYYKVFRYNMLEIYLNIFRGIMPSIIVAALSTYIISCFTEDSILSFVLKIGLFCLTYTLALALFGLSDEDKRIFTFTRDTNY